MTLAERILVLVEERAPKTACPSEVARAAFGPAWREHMREVREAAAALCREGRVVVTQRGRPVDPLAARGPIRLRKP